MREANAKSVACFQAGLKDCVDKVLPAYEGMSYLQPDSALNALSLFLLKQIYKLSMYVMSSIKNQIARCCKVSDLRQETRAQWKGLAF